MRDCNLKKSLNEMHCVLTKDSIIKGSQQNKNNKLISDYDQIIYLVHLEPSNNRLKLF